MKDIRRIDIVMGYYSTLIQVSQEKIEITDEQGYKMEIPSEVFDLLVLIKNQIKQS